MIKIIIENLRAIAQTSSNCARDCKLGDLSRALQELSVELTTKARELEDKFDK
jgi:hypothetical protein